MKKHTSNNIVYDDKMSKKEQQNQHQYIFSHINRTNSITFKEKYDFFYFHAKKILDKDVKDDEEAFIDILKNNAQLSLITKNKSQQNKSSSNFNINNDNDSIIGKLKRVYIKQQHEANKSFSNKKPKHKSILADMLQVNSNENTKSSLISSLRKKMSNSMLIERKKFFDLERMNGYQLFNFFKNEKQFEIYDRQINIAKTLKNPLLRAKKLLPSNSLNNTFNSNNNLFNSTFINKNRNSYISIIPNQTHHDFKNSFININHDFDKSFNNNNNNLVQSNTHRESLVSSLNETSNHINSTNLFNSKNSIIRMNSNNNTFLNSERQMDNSIIKENSHNESTDLNRQRNLKNSSNKNNYANFNDLMKMKDGSETIDSRSSIKQEAVLNNIIKDDFNFNDHIHTNDKEKNIKFNIPDNAILDKKLVLPLKKVKKNKINYFRKSTTNNDFNKESFLDKINGNNNDVNSDMNNLNIDKNTLYSTHNFNRSTLSNTLRSRKQLNQSEINTTSIKPSFKEIKLFNNLARNDSMTELDKNKVLWKNSLSNFMKHKDISKNLETPPLNKSIAKNPSLISVNKKEDIESSNKILKFKSILEKVSNKQDIQSKSLNKITKKDKVNNDKSKNKNKKVRFFRRESNNSNSFRNKSESSFDSSAQLTNYNNNSKKKRDEVKNNKIKEFKLKQITREFFKEKVYYNQTKESILKEKQVKIKNQTKKHRQSINLANEVKKLGRTSFFIKRNNALKNVISQNEFSKELSKLIKEKEEEYKKLFITKTSEEEKEEEINKFINDFQEKKRQEEVLKIKNNPHQTLIKITKNLDIDKNEDNSNDNISLSESIKKRLNNISNKYNESLEVNKSNPEDEESKGNEKRSSVFAKDKKIQDKLANKQLAELIPGFDLNTLKPIKKQIIDNKEITIDYFTNIPMKLRDLIRIDFLIIKKEYKPRGITPKKYKIKNTILGNNFTKLIINHALKLQSKVKKCNSDDFNFRERVKQINDQKTKKKKNYINIFFLSKNIPLTRSQLMLNELVNEDSSSEEKDLLHLRKKDDYNEKGNYQVSDSSNNEQMKKRNATKKSTVNLKKYLINSTKNLYPTKNLSKNVFNVNSINELSKKNNELISVKNLDDKVKQNREFLITEEEELEKEISMKNSDSESEDSSSVERFTILKNQENLNYLEPYLFDNFSKDYNKLIYKGKLLDVTKVLERNKIPLLNRLDPGIFKTYDMITAFRKYGKAKKSDIDIIIEYMEQKVEEIDRFLYKFNIHYLKHEYEKATFPIFEKEFNKLFMNYPYLIRDFMKQRYFSKFGDPFKNPRIMMNISEAITKANGKFKKEVTNKSSNRKTIVDEILEKYPPYYQLKRQKERFKIKGTMKILDVPNAFNKINLYEKNEILGKEMKQKFNFKKEDYLKDISIPKYKYLKEPKLKGYKSFKRSLDFLQEESSKNHNNLIKTQKYFAKKSLYVDPSLCVIEQRDFNEPEKKVPIKNMWIQ